jgi:hypothetical protein
MRHELLAKVPGSSLLPCSGGRGDCPNEPEYIVATHSERLGKPLRQERSL